MAIQLQEGYKTAKKSEKYETPSCVIAKTLNTQNKKDTELWGMYQVTYKEHTSRIFLNRS